MATVFVTGSGTGIGKTFVCCRLLQALPAGLAVRCVKPVVTGFDPADAPASDPGRLLAARHIAIDEAALAATSPWRFRAPLSADMAAARENRTIPFDELVAFSRPPAGVGMNLIEGIGGVMAPLDAGHTVLDWIAALEAPALVVVGSYLGALSHALTAIDALVHRGIAPLAVVVSQSADEPVPAAESAAVLGRFAGDSPIIVLPRDENADAAGLAALLIEGSGLA